MTTTAPQPPLDPDEFAAVEQAIATAQRGDFFSLTDEEARLCLAIYEDPAKLTASEVHDLELFLRVLVADHQRGRTRRSDLGAAEHSLLRILRRGARRILETGGER